MPPTQHSREGFLISFGLKGRHHFITFGKAANVQTFFVRRAAAKTGLVRGVSFLDDFFRHMFLAKRRRHGVLGI